MTVMEKIIITNSIFLKDSYGERKLCRRSDYQLIARMNMSAVPGIHNEFQGLKAPSYVTS